MKGLMAVLAALGGLLWWRNRQQHAPAPHPDPAEELRAKLAEARAADDREEFEAGEQPVSEAVSIGDNVADARPEDPAASGDGGQVDVRRQDVHERARSAIDELGAE